MVISLQDIPFFDLVVPGPQGVRCAYTVPALARPFANEHACRHEDPDKYEAIRRENNWQEHEGKRMDAIWGITSGGVVELQSVRYPAGEWAADDARAHCKSHGGISFEAATSARGAIPYHDYGLAAESVPWDGPREMAAASVETLRDICAWYDGENPDLKGSYKLPHHRGSDKKAVWRGVAAAMGALLGARGGVDIPAGDKRGVYRHLARHYTAFGKEVPEFQA
jgi:hypothetical protein